MLSGNLIPWEYKFTDNLMLLLLPNLDYIPDYFFTEGGYGQDEVDRLKFSVRGLIESQFHFFYAIMDVEKDKVVGIIWLSYNPIHLYINLHLIYIKREYQDGKTMERFVDFVKEGLACVEAKRIVTFTDHPRVAKRKKWGVNDTYKLAYYSLKEE